jgi:hypothetical protein
MVWRPSADSPQSVGVFARVMGAPGDRNLVDLGVKAGTREAPGAASVPAPSFVRRHTARRTNASCLHQFGT